MHYNLALSVVEATPLRSSAPDGVQTRLVIGPNASLSVAQAWVFMGLTSVLGLGIAGMFAFLGFWPILPFAGLELAALGLALWLALRRNRYREVVVFGGTWVRVEYGLAGEGAKITVEWPRAWVRVRLESVRAPGQGPTRLSLNYAGRQAVIGDCLTDAERERLATRLRELLSPSASAGGLETGRT